MAAVQLRRSGPAALAPGPGAEVAAQVVQPLALAGGALGLFRFIHGFKPWQRAKAFASPNRQGFSACMSHGRPFSGVGQARHDIGKLEGLAAPASITSGSPLCSVSLLPMPPMPCLAESVELRAARESDCK